MKNRESSFVLILQRPSAIKKILLEMKESLTKQMELWAGVEPCHMGDRQNLTFEYMY